MAPPGAFSTSCLPRLLLVFPPTLWPLPSQSRSFSPYPAACSPHVILWSSAFTISSVFTPFAHYLYADISQMVIFIFSPCPFPRVQVAALNCRATYSRRAKVPEAQYFQIKPFFLSKRIPPCRPCSQWMTTVSLPGSGPRRVLPTFFFPTLYVSNQEVLTTSYSLCPGLELWLVPSTSTGLSTLMLASGSSVFLEQSDWPLMT